MSSGNRKPTLRGKMIEMSFSWLLVIRCLHACFSHSHASPFLFMQCVMLPPRRCPFRLLIYPTIFYMYSMYCHLFHIHYLLINWEIQLNHSVFWHSSVHSFIDILPSFVPPSLGRVQTFCHLSILIIKYPPV